MVGEAVGLRIAIGVAMIIILAVFLLGLLYWSYRRSQSQ